MFEIKNLVHRYGKRVVLKIDALAVKGGSILGFVGPNGSGKSTLLRILSLLEPFSEGELLYGGTSVKGRESSVRRDVTLLLQEPYLLRRSVYDNLRYGLALRGDPSLKSKEAVRTRIHESLEAVGLSPDRFARRAWFQLSGGEAQRVALATRLALRPRVLLLDEPTANVDELSAILVKQAALAAVREWGTTLVVSTHDLAWLYEVATDIVSLYGGHIVGRGPMNFLYEGSTATIFDPSDVFLSVAPPREPDDTVRILRGHVVQLILEGGSGDTLVIVDVAGGVIKSRISLDASREMGIYPGMPIWVAYPTAALTQIRMSD